MRKSRIFILHEQTDHHTPAGHCGLLKIVSLAKAEKDWLKKDLADGLNLANSEITKVFDRLKFTGLIVGTRNSITYVL